MQKRKRKGKVGQENNYGSGRNGKRIRGRNRNNFDEMENEFQLPTSYDNQDDDFNLLDMMSTGYKRWPEKWWIPPGSSGSSNTEESTKKEEIERYKNELKEVKAEEEKAKKQIHNLQYKSVETNLAKYIQLKTLGGPPHPTIICNREHTKSIENSHALQRVTIGMSLQERLKYKTNLRLSECYSESGTPVCNTPTFCRSPCGCLIYGAKNDYYNQLQIWSGTNPTWKQILSQLELWGMPEDMIVSFEMAIESEIEKVKVFEITSPLFGYQTKAKSGLSLGIMQRKANGNIEIGYLALKNSATLSPLYKCKAYDDRKNGIFKPRCEQRGLTATEARQVGGNLHYFALESVKYLLRK
jgi:hypothetical protein